jgi:hypothetical protein
MYKFRNLGARPLGVAAAAAMAVGLVSFGPAAAMPAGAAQDAGSASIANNTLTVTGTNGADVVSFSADATTIQVTVGTTVQRFDLAAFTTVNVSLGNGDDQFTEQAGVLGDKHLTVDGGNGNDTIQTGDGRDVVLGGNGDDRVDAGRGNDTVSLGDGKDFFVWEPGQGSDVVDGGNGIEDVMQFDGADVAETMSLSSNGPQAVFLRSPGAVRMDMDGIELFNLNTFGGVDNLTVNSLEGTSIRHENIDLSAANGGSDHAGDAVTVNGTNAADRVAITAHDDQIAVDGFAADATIVGSEPLDHLQVNTLDGNDRVDVDPAVSALIGVAVDLGAGQL